MGYLRVDGKEPDEDVLASIDAEVEIVEEHVHNLERWFGAAAVPDGEVHVADDDSMTPFVLDADNDDWGGWVQLLGSDDTPNRTDMTKYDGHRILITDVERDKEITRIQMGVGDSGAAALAAGTYTEVMLTPEKLARSDPFAIITLRADVGVKLWGRCWVDGQNTGEVDLFFGIHEYLV